DGAGNVSAVLPIKGAEKTLLIGSHLDSVYSGGRFDGTLGLLAAFESLRVLRESGQPLAQHVEAIDFTDEEGTLVGLLGSSALTGLLKTEALKAPRGGRRALEEGLTRLKSFFAKQGD
ncbi:MAG: M20/M25/M40 family metallo-hydrolase, partial [Acidobacteria bacterium]|nr:M20/M25/M40 family metallo-hydrolase [Acidobacteriota bacterium]